MKSRVKNREVTKRKLLDAVGRIVHEDGFGGLGVNRVAKLAETSKILIYRYFESFEELLYAYILENNFWVHASLLDFNYDRLDLPLNEVVNRILEEQFNSFYNHCEMEARLINEMSNANYLVKRVVREDEHADRPICYRVISTLLMAGIDHLTLEFDGPAKDNSDLCNRKKELRQSIGQIVDWTLG